jgi:hypothetical protein
MQACSLLLGRPWQYDNSVIHHGRTNSYTLVFEGKTINLLPMNPTEIVNSEKARAPGNIKVDNLHALLVFNSPIPDFNVPSDEHVPSDHDNLDCIHETKNVTSDVQVKSKQLLVSEDTCAIYITKYGCLFGSALFSWLNNFQAMESRGRLCFQEREDDETITCLDTTKSIAHIYNCQVISICNLFIIDCIIGCKNTTHASVLCRTVEDMDTLHDAMSTLNTMSKSLPIQLHAWLFHVAKTQKKKQRALASNTDQADPVQKSSCKWSGEHAGARRSSVYYAAQILHR